MKIIGIHGRAISGKNFVGDFLQSKFSTFEQTSFATQMKKMLHVGLNIPDIWLNSNIKDQFFEEYECTPRHIMQTLGTEWGRKMIHPDIWVIALHNHVKNQDKTFVITDVRFENEANYCRTHGLLIHIVGRGGINSNHESEKGVEFKEGDIVFDNSLNYKDDKSKERFKNLYTTLKGGKL